MSNEIVPAQPQALQPIEAMAQAADMMSLSLLFSLGREYLNVPFQQANFIQPYRESGRLPPEAPHFLRLEQVGDPPPHSPYHPFAALQTALAACHDPGRYTLLFTVTSDGQRNNVYLGVRGNDPAAQPYDFANYLGQFLEGNWPGTQLKRCDYKQDIVPNIIVPLGRDLCCAAALTGIPSLRKLGDESGYPQSLDRLLRGLRGRPFMYMVIAEPMPTGALDEIIYHCRDLLSRVHTLKKMNLIETLTRQASFAEGQTDTTQMSQTKGTSVSHAVSDSITKSTSRNVSHSETQSINKTENPGAIIGAIGGGLGWLAASLIGGPLVGILGAVTLTGAIGGGSRFGQMLLGPRQKSNTTSDTFSDSFSESSSHSISDTASVSESVSFGISTASSRTQSFSQSEAQALGKEYLNTHAEAAERLLQQYIARFEQARAQGCWQVGVYLVAEASDIALQGATQLRALLSGEKSVFEPIRVHDLERVWAYGVQKELSHFQLPNLGLNDPQTGQPFDHPLGPAFSGLTTPLNTEELALLVNLPRREVSGVRVMPTADFSLNLPAGDGPTLSLGHLLEGGKLTPLPYTIPLATLAKHALVTGITGSGKSTTCHKLLHELRHLKIPFLVIEPAKDEYVEWAMALNQNLSPDDAGYINIYMPGVKSWRGRGLDQALALNPFDLIWLPGQAEPQVLAHLDRLKSILIAAFPMQEVLPVLLEEALYHAYHKPCDWLGDKLPAPDDPRPTFSQMVNQLAPVIKSKGYDEKITANLTAALLTRLQSLRRGWKKDLFDQPRSTPWAELFDRPAIINLSRLGDEADRALAMGVLLQFLYEYREAQREVSGGDGSWSLQHLTVIEEAHRVLLRASPGTPEQANPQAKAAEMFANILSEIRAYGEGLMIVDQVPARLTPDAVKNTNLKIIHRLIAGDDRDAMAASMALTSDQAAIINRLKSGQAIVYGAADDMAAWVQVKPV